MALKQINHGQLEKLFNVVMHSGHPLLIVGKPGQGKTRACKAFTASNNVDLIISHPAVDKPVDIKGLPAKSTKTVEISWQDSNSLDGLDDADGLLAGLADTEPAEQVDVATFLPFGQMLQVLTATKPTIWFFDDFGQAPTAMQCALMQVIGDREICGRKIPDCVKIAAATNGRDHKAGVQGLLEPIKSRFGMIVELVATIKDFRQFAVTHGLHKNVQFFLEFHPEALDDFKVTKSMENNPNPRLWEKLSEQLQALEAQGMDEEDLREIIACGCIGSAWGLQFAAFERLNSQIASYEEIIADWEDYPINQPLDVRFAMLAMLATKGKARHGNEIFGYVTKMAKEFQVAFFRMARSHNEELVQSDAAQRWWAGNLDVYID